MNIKLSKYAKISVGLSIVSILSILIANILLLIIALDAKLLAYVWMLSGFLIIVNAVQLYDVFSKEKPKLKESIPLMRHRMHRALTTSILLFGIGIPLFINAYKDNLYENMLMAGTSLFLIGLGLIIYFVVYIPRDRQIERELINRNKKNKK